MNEQPAPEFWDGGYWYVVPCEYYKPGHRRPVSTPVRWTAVYGIVDGVDYALLRSPDVWLQAPTVPVSVDGVITAASAQGFLPAGFTGKPGMRAEGL